MELERDFVNFIMGGRFENLPKETVDIVKNIILTATGAAIAGARAEGCESVINQVKEWGGKEEATILIHGGKVPAYNAAFANSTLVRALDIEDSMKPGMHVSASAFPTALAAAEVAGSCSGKEFITALAYGLDMSIRINSASVYNGFDPSGVCGIFAAIAAAGRLLHLNSAQMWDALALGFNRPVQTFQSIVDGTLAVRVGQGVISQGAMMCIQLAQRGINGPKNFLEGVFGYFHLYANDKYDRHVVTRELGKRFELDKIMFKKYPSCGGTISSTDCILLLMGENNLTPENVAEINVRVTPYVYDENGGQFKIRDNPRVDAQFSIQYCVANALLRKVPKLQHFDESYVRDPKIMELIGKIHVAPSPALEGEKWGASMRADMDVTTTDGVTYHKSVPIPSGFPGNPLKNEEIRERFQQAVSYSSKPLPKENIDRLISIIDQLEQAEDVCALIPLMMSKNQ
jgi:2-methylcitrate dehydratase PrpD